MGFTEEVARRVLAESVWDVNKAIDKLLQSGVASEEKQPLLPAESWPRKHGASTPRSLGQSVASSPAVARCPADGEQRVSASRVPASDAHVETPEPLGAGSHPRSASTSGSSERGMTCAAEPTASEASPAEALASAPRERIERVETPWQAEDVTQITVAR